MTLQERAASLLDRTHKSVLTSDPYYQRTRDYLAAWLDGIKIKRSTVLTCIRCLQRVA
jgi:hypothetical protein